LTRIDVSISLDGANESFVLSSSRTTPAPGNAGNLVGFRYSVFVVGEGIGEAKDKPPDACGETLNALFQEV
jgi:hypothetical protein